MRAYNVVTDEYEGHIVSIVADSSKEARLIAYNSGECDLPWIEIKPKWNKNIDVSGLQKGVVPPIDGLKVGLYGWIEDECPNCKKLVNLYLSIKETLLCAKCCEEAKKLYLSVKTGG